MRKWRGCARVSFSSVAGVADPGRGAERLSEGLFGMGADAKKRIRIRVLRDVARRPSVETGAGVPGQREVNFPVEH